MGKCYRRGRQRLYALQREQGNGAGQRAADTLECKTAVAAMIGQRCLAVGLARASRGQPGVIKRVLLGRVLSEQQREDNQQVA